MSARRMTYEEWQAYQKRQMSWLAERIGQLQRQVWDLTKLYNAQDQMLADIAVSRETESKDATLF